MGWMIKMLSWKRLFVLILFTLGVTGSVMYLLMRAFAHIFKVKNPYLRLVWQKAVLLSFVIPFLFIFFFQRHVRWYESTAVILGVFWEGEVGAGIYVVVEIVWLCGFLVALARMLLKQRRLRAVWRENEAVDDPVWLELFEEYKKRFCLQNVRLYRNPLLMSPVSACRRRPMIVLPDREYSPKELHMILTHEMNHIRHRDLLWRKVAIVAGWVNWYLPLPKLLQKELVYQQEMICDLRSGTGNPAFSQREYGRFLVSLTDNEWGNAPFTALCESENIIIRRLEVMKQAKDMKKPKRWIVAATCAGLAVLALIPSGIVSAKVIAWEENRIYSLEDATEVQMQDLENIGEEHTEYADMTVTEIDLSQEAVGYVYGEDINCETAVNTRDLYTTRSMSLGNMVIILASCDDEDAVFRVGVKNVATGMVSYIEGTDVLMYFYTVQSDGNYVAYVENRSSRTIEVAGTITYKENNIDSDAAYDADSEMISADMCVVTESDEMNAEAEISDYDSETLEMSEENVTALSETIYELSPDEAKAMLEEYLLDVNLLDDDSELCEQTIHEIDGIDVYCFDVRFKEQVPDVGGRLIGMYGIATDGSKYYQNDIANGVWVEGNIYGYERGE